MDWQNALDRFIRHLALEKGLADNTLLAYENDLTRYIHHLKDQHIKVGNKISPLFLQKYIGQLYDLGLASSSMARNFSAIRSFHKYLM
jgi:integrase/recombinase XerD